jgi:hypothetical protein
VTARALILVVAAACGSPSRPPVGVAKPAPATAAPSQLDQFALLFGDWHSEIFDAHWENVAGAIYGASLGGDEFEVNIIDDSDDDGKPAPITLSTYEDGTELQTFKLVAATPDKLEFTGSAGLVRFTPTDKGWRGDFMPPDGVQIGFNTLPRPLGDGAEVEAADRAFDADTAKDGADGWVRHFDDHGAMWRGQRVEGADAVRAAITKILSRGTLRWAPVAGGTSKDLGYTLGTGTFTPTGGAPVKVSYCTIWHRQPDGSWKVLFDVGRPAD